MNLDITFCTKDCLNTRCERNLKYLDKNIFKEKPFISMAEFNNCENFIENKK